MKKLLYIGMLGMLGLPLTVSAHIDSVDSHTDEGMGYWPGMGHMFGSGAFSWFGYLMAIIWLVIGVLVIIWLWQKINKK
ncbi:MAG: hypothetical protein HYW51_03605 [Candidatus Doudnabacteria bacterium]|nr:hypothetical protein [Candidatus Doudnabacteria bacterium]